MFRALGLRIVAVRDIAGNWRICRDAEQTVDSGVADLFPEQRRVYPMMSGNGRRKTQNTVIEMAIKRH